LFSDETFPFEEWKRVIFWWKPFQSSSNSVH